MATENVTETITLKAGADLSGGTGQYRFVKHSAGTARTCELAGDGERVVGVLLNKPALAQAATIQVAGIAKVIAGSGTITAGGTVASGASGVVTAAVGTEFNVGIALEGSTAAGKVISVQLQGLD